MDRMKCEAQTQIALEDDINIADIKPDVFSVVTENGEVEIEEVRALEDHILVKGKLHFCILYISDEEIHRPAGMGGTLSFEERLFVKGVQTGEIAFAEGRTEDLSVGMINSRKLSVQALLRLRVWTEEAENTLMAVGVSSQEPVEVLKQPLQALHLSIRKKDIFRVKKELELPDSMPNIFQVLWQSCVLGEMMMSVEEECLRLQGEAKLFLFYEGEGEKRPFMWYETAIPIQGSMECQGMRSDMLENISCRIGHKEIEVRTDEGGEERKIGVDLVLDLDMKLYEELQTERLADLYSVKKEVEVTAKDGSFQRLLTRNTGKCRVGGRLQTAETEPEIQKICVAMGEVLLDKTEASPEGLEVRGTLEVKVLYATKDPEMPFYSLKKSVPFSYTLEVPGGNQQMDSWQICPVLEHLQAAASDGKEMEVKAQIALKSFVCTGFCEPVVVEATLKEPDQLKAKALPGIVAYIAGEKDNLWSIGKRYSVPVQNLREMNHLQGEEIRTGEKLLIVKG